MPGKAPPPKDIEQAQMRMDEVLRGDHTSFFSMRFAVKEGQTTPMAVDNNNGPWPQPNVADDYFEQGQRAAQDHPTQRFARGGGTTFQSEHVERASDGALYAAQWEVGDDGTVYLKDAGDGDMVHDVDRAGSAGVSAKDLPSTMACSEAIFATHTCAFCNRKDVVVGFQMLSDVFNETRAKKLFAGAPEDAATKKAMDELAVCVEAIGGTPDQRKWCMQARAVCKARECRMRAGMIDAVTEAKWLALTGENQRKHDFNRKHHYKTGMLDSLCKVHLLYADDRCERSWVPAVLDDMTKISYWMCLQQKYFITAGTLLATESEAFGLRLNEDARANLAEKMAQAPALMFIKLLTKHVLDLSRGKGTDLGNNGKRLGVTQSWYWHITKNLLGRCWPKPLFVAYVELKVQQWIATGCPCDAQGRPRFVLKQQPDNPLLPDFWNGPEAQSKLLQPVFQDAKRTMGLLNRKEKKAQHSTNLWQAIQQATKTSGPNGRPTRLHEVMALARCVGDPMADGRANAPLVHVTRIRGKEYAVRDHSFITSDQDLDMIGCLDSAALGLQLAEAKEFALQRALPKGIVDAATAKEMTVGAYFVSEYLQVLTLVRIGSSAMFAVGPKPEILDESGTRYAVVNAGREKAASRITRNASFTGIVKRTLKCIFNRTRRKRVDEQGRVGLRTKNRAECTPEVQGVLKGLTEEQYDAPGLAMDHVVRELVRILVATGELPTLATHPLPIDRVRADMGDYGDPLVVLQNANRISAAHAHFNLFRQCRGVVHPNHFDIMEKITTDALLYPGRLPGQSEDAWKKQLVFLIKEWLCHTRVMLQRAQQLQHRLLHVFYAPYTTALKKALCRLEPALVQFFHPVRLPAVAEGAQMSAQPLDLASLPLDNPWHERQRGATAQWEANYARDVHAGRVEDTEEAKTAYFTRDAMHSERCVEMARCDLKARYRAVCDALVRREDPATAPSYEAWLKTQRIDTDGLDYRLPDEEQRRLKFAETALCDKWAEITKRYAYQVSTIGPHAKDVVGVDGKSVNPKQALCNHFLEEGKALFFEQYPLLCEMVRDGACADGKAHEWYRVYFAELHQRSGGAGFRHFREHQDAAKDPTGMPGIRHLYASHSQIASAKAILAHKDDKAKLDALTAHLERMAGLRPRPQLPAIAAEDVQDAADRNKNDDDGSGDNDDHSDDDAGPGDAAAVGQKRPSRKKGKPTTVDQRHTKKKKDQAPRHHDAHELGFKDEREAHNEALKMSEKEQVHPTTFLPPSFANQFRVYDSKRWGGDAAPSSAKKALAKKAPAKKAPGKKAPAKASTRQRRRPTVVESSDEDEEEEEEVVESEEEGRDSADSEDEDDATRARRNAAQAEQDAAAAAAQRHLFTPAD